MLFRWLPISLFAVVPSISAAQGAQASQPKIDARTDGFLGPIHAVSTQVEMSGVKWQQPDGPGLLIPIWCRDCTYDQDGMRTRQGAITADGSFAGNTITVVRDADGKPVERTITSSPGGRVYIVERFGPFGPTETATYQDGKLTSTGKITYDSAGHLTQSISFGPDGEEQGRVEGRYAEDGTETSQIIWQNGGQLFSRMTFDPETDFQRFETFEPDGAAKLQFMFAHGKVLSYWTAVDEKRQFGDTFTDDKGNGNTNRFHCYRGGECDLSKVHIDYTDSTKRYPTSAEWRDADGNLLYAAYYEYEFDAQKNWTQRKVWVIGPEVSGRTLYETDTRTIVYWPD
jgi:hypothetical protein